MAREISTTDTSEGVAKRGDDGELIPEEHTVSLPNGEEVIIKTKPITTGLLNELSELDDAVQRLEPRAVKEAFETIYLSDALCNMSVEEIRDTKSEYLSAYLKPLDDAIEDDIGDEEGNLKEMDKQERAKQMR